MGPFEITGDLTMVMNSQLTVRILAKDENIVKVIAVCVIMLGKYNTASPEFIFFREQINKEFDPSHS